MGQGRIRFIIVRHGETEWNVQQRYQGQLDSPLTANGVRQAEAIAARLAAVRADALVCSDLQRARDTAAAILRHQRHDIPVCYTESLRERHFGILGGLTRAEALQKLPGVLANYTSGNADYTPPQGESLRDLYHRAAAAMNALALEFGSEGGPLEDAAGASPLGGAVSGRFNKVAHADASGSGGGQPKPTEGERTVIVVTHGGFLGQFMRYVLAIPLEAARAYKFVNAAYNEFSCGVPANSCGGVAGAAAGEGGDGGGGDAFSGVSAKPVTPAAGHFDRVRPHDWLLHVWGDVAHLGDLEAGDDL